MSDTDFVNRRGGHTLCYVMPRARRFVLPGFPVHVVHRGNNRSACFVRPEDHLVYLSLLRDVSKDLACAIHAYCLMPNHVHLLITPADASACSTLMKAVAQRYSLHFNKQHVRTGTLWEGRFRSSVVESREYVLACHKYIEQNPVRAQLVRHPSEYRWSSYSGNSGLTTDAVLTRHEELHGLGFDAYRNLVLDDAQHAIRIREATKRGYPLGSDQFRSKLKSEGVQVSARRPGRKRTENDSVSDTDSSVAVPDLFSGGGAS